VKVAAWVGEILGVAVGLGVCLKTKKLRIAIILDTNCTYIPTSHA
jgi:ABC-type lipoprotein release transport system permease subunit